MTEIMTRGGETVEKLPSLSKLPFFINQTQSKANYLDQIYFNAVEILFLRNLSWLNCFSWSHLNKMFCLLLKHSRGIYDCGRESIKLDIIKLVGLVEK